MFFDYIYESIFSLDELTVVAENLCQSVVIQSDDIQIVFTVHQKHFFCHLGYCNKSKGKKGCIYLLLLPDFSRKIRNQAQSYHKLK